MATKIIGIKNMTIDDLNRELGQGGKFVIFQYCISILILTFKRPSDIYFIRAGEGTIKKSIGFTIVSLLLGWWGIPWGPIYTIGSLVTNLSGGKNVTEEVVASLRLPPGATTHESTPQCSICGQHVVLSGFTAHMEAHRAEQRDSAALNRGEAHL